MITLPAADDYKDEKRRITAAMLRRLEVEEWDKERMKHFYYGGCGGPDEPSEGQASWRKESKER